MKLCVPATAAAAFLVGIVVAQDAPADAAEDYQVIQKNIPNGLAGLDPSSGISCPPLGYKQCNEYGELNEFGEALKAAGYEWTKELCEADSDGDGESNGSELGDPCCLWSPSNRNPKGFRVTNLSNPGDPNEDGSMVAPKCDEFDETMVAPEGSVDESVPPEDDEVVDDGTSDEGDETEYGQEEGGDGGSSGDDEVATEAPPLTTEGPVETTEAPSITVAPVEVTTKSMTTESAASTCSKSKTSCADGSECCDSSEQCTDTPWEGAGSKTCLPKPPVCYNGGERCAGADGYEFVPYAACCESSQVCMEDTEKGWGRFCITPPAGYKDGSSAEGVATDTPTTVAPVVTTTYAGTEAPVKTTSTDATEGVTEAPTVTTTYTAEGTEAPAESTPYVPEGVTEAPVETTASTVSEEAAGDVEVDYDAYEE